MAARPLIAIALLLASAACVSQPHSSPAPAAASAAPQGADARLARLFHDSDEASLRRNPLSATFRGDYRYADRLGDLYSDAYYAAERAAAEQELAALHAIPRNALTPTNRIAYDVFQWQRSEDLADLQPDMLALTAVLSATLLNDAGPVRSTISPASRPSTRSSPPAAAPRRSETRSITRTTSSATSSSRSSSTGRSAASAKGSSRASSKRS